MVTDTAISMWEKNQFDQGQFNLIYCMWFTQTLLPMILSLVFLEMASTYNIFYQEAMEST